LDGVRRNALALLTLVFASVTNALAGITIKHVVIRPAAQTGPSPPNARWADYRAFLIKSGIKADLLPATPGAPTLRSSSPARRSEFTLLRGKLGLRSENRCIFSDTFASFARLPVKIRRNVCAKRTL